MMEGGSLAPAAPATDLRGYIELAMQCGFPELLQEQGRHEIDLLAEIGAERVIGIEVKATSAKDSSSASHLTWLSERLGDRFIAGVVLHTGPASFPLGDRITAAPISTLWA